MVLSTVSSSKVELTARPTSPSAFSSRPSARARRPRLQLLEQAHVFNGDHRLVGERLEQLDLLVRERSDFHPADHDRPDGLSLA
jgi:hypothetical protein